MKTYLLAIKIDKKLTKQLKNIYLPPIFPLVFLNENIDISILKDAKIPKLNFENTAKYKNFYHLKCKNTLDINSMLNIKDSSVDKTKDIFDLNVGILTEKETNIAITSKKYYFCVFEIIYKIEDENFQYFEYSQLNTKQVVFNDD